MALDFAKGNRSIAFNPTSAFPLDARSYFESYDIAVDTIAAKTGEAGDTTKVYYYGQTIAVVENGTASLYIIQPNKTLSPVAGSKIIVDKNAFVFDADGNLSLVGFGDASSGAVLTKSADGKLIWTQPVDAYSKTETDELIAAAVAEVDHLKRKIVSDLAEAETYVAENDDASQFIFMVPVISENEEANDKYDEYMVIEIADTKVLEKVGSWSVDLSDYAKIDNVNTELDKKVDKLDGHSLISDSALAKLNAIAEGAEKNYISSVDTHFLVENGQLKLQPLSYTDITDLQAELDKKVNKQEGWSLLSPTDQEKLSKLVIDGNGLSISGNVNADNVQGLADWLNTHAGSTKGLSEENFTAELKTKLDSLLLITSVEETELKIDNGHLSILEVDQSKITGLQEALSARPVESVVNTKISSAITDLNAAIAATYVLKSDYDKDIQEIRDILTWQEIIV